MQYPIRVLFVCRRDSVRAPMAAALLRHLGGKDFDVHHAGMEPRALDGQAAALLSRLGVQPDHIQGRGVSDFIGRDFDYVITLCDKRYEDLADFPGDERQVRWDFPDPEASGPGGGRERVLQRLYMELVERIRLWVEMEHQELQEQGLVERDRFAWSRAARH